MCVCVRVRAEYKELCKRALELPQQCTDFMYLFQTAWQNLLHTATDGKIRTPAWVGVPGCV